MHQSNFYPTSNNACQDPNNDNLELGESFHEFVTLFTGSVVQIPIVCQDSTSVISLITEGGEICCPKHLMTCINLGRESLNEKCLIVYCEIQKKWWDNFHK